MAKELIYLDLDDKSIGETFVHDDWRFPNRHIKLLGVVKIHPERGRVYRYVTITNDVNPVRIGKHGQISLQTLEREFRRSSK